MHGGWVDEWMRVGGGRGGVLLSQSVSEGILSLRQKNNKTSKKQQHDRNVSINHAKLVDRLWQDLHAFSTSCENRELYSV